MYICIYVYTHIPASVAILAQEPFGSTSMAVLRTMVLPGCEWTNNEWWMEHHTRVSYHGAPRRKIKTKRLENSCASWGSRAHLQVLHRREEGAPEAHLLHRPGEMARPPPHRMVLLQPWKHPLGYVQLPGDGRRLHLRGWAHLAPQAGLPSVQPQGDAPDGERAPVRL